MTTVARIWLTVCLTLITYQQALFAQTVAETAQSDQAGATQQNQNAERLPAIEDDPAPVPISMPPNPFTGDLWSRSRISGDWWGARSGLAEKGMTLDLFATQFYQGVASGGRQEAWEYGGKIDYLANLDGAKAGLWQGFFVSMHAETRFGNSVNNIDGLLAPSNIAMQFPDPNSDITSITGLKFTQALSENFAVYFGKINTLDEYPVRYGLFSQDPGMGRPGISGFMNTSLVFNPIAARTVPYSTAAVGAAFLSNGAPFLTCTVFDPEERAATGMQGMFSKGAVIVPDLILRTKFLDRPGVFNIGGTYSSSRYRSFDPAAYLSIPPALLLDDAFTPLETGSWCVYTNCYQAVWVDSADETRTWGVFGQFGVSDGNPNPIAYTANAGVGGRSMMQNRKLDSMGAGFFYVGLSDSFKALSAPILRQQNECGVELFYNWAFTPASRLTLDLQVASPSTQAFDAVIIPGLRMQLLF